MLRLIYIDNVCLKQSVYFARHIGYLLIKPVQKSFPFPFPSGLNLLLRLYMEVTIKTAVNHCTTLLAPWLCNSNSSIPAYVFLFALCMGAD